MKSTLKKYAGEILLGVVCFTVFSFLFHRQQMGVTSSAGVQWPKTPVPKNTKKNIFILSVCSLKYSQMNLFGYEKRRTTPNLTRFFSGENSLVFGSAFNSQSWTSLLSFLDIEWDSRFLLSHGYVGPVMHDKFLLRIPDRLPRGQVESPSGSAKVPEYVGGDFGDHDLDYSAQLATLEASLSRPNSPFFFVAHLKYMHFPYQDLVNKNAGWQRFLSATSRRRLAEYEKNFIEYPDKLPLFILLWNDPQKIKDLPEVRAWLERNPELAAAATAGSGLAPGWLTSVGPLSGLIYNEAWLQRWQQSAGYEQDLRLIEEIYDAKLAHMDEFLRPTLELLNNDYHRRHTLVIFAGDHGQAFMEHGKLLHGQDVFDESLRVPLMIRWPTDVSTETTETYEKADQGKSQRVGQQVSEQVSQGDDRQVSHQVYLGSVSRFLEEYIAGRKPLQELKAEVFKKSGDYILARNCRNTLFSVREKNRWKWVQDMTDGQMSLYDLQADPQEIQDVAAAHPEIVARLRSVFYELYPAFHKPDKEFCPDWPEW